MAWQGLLLATSLRVDYFNSRVLISLVAGTYRGLLPVVCNQTMLPGLVDRSRDLGEA